jgi:hypothetical protein
VVKGSRSPGSPGVARGWGGEVSRGLAERE